MTQPFTIAPRLSLLSSMCFMAVVGTIFQRRLHRRVELGHVERLAGDEADLGHASQHRCIFRRRRGGAAHQLRHHVEVGRRCPCR